MRKVYEVNTAEELRRFLDDAPPWAVAHINENVYEELAREKETGTHELPPET